MAIRCVVELTKKKNNYYGLNIYGGATRKKFRGGGYINIIYIYYQVYRREGELWPRRNYGGDTTP